MRAGYLRPEGFAIDDVPLCGGDGVCGVAEAKAMTQAKAPITTAKEPAR
jgi:hypothetical protein